MQNLQFSILLLLLFSVASHASMETGDNLIPVYHVIPAEALPGLSDFMTPRLITPFIFELPALNYRD